MDAHQKLYVLTLSFYFTLAAYQIHFAMYTLIVQQRKSHQRRIQALLFSTRKRSRKRCCWVKKGRTSAWWDNFLKNEVPLSEWKENFRMSRKNFTELCDMLRPYLQRKSTKMREPISVETQIAAFLYYISDEGRYRKTANAFGISRASVSIIVKKVSCEIVKHLASVFIKLPTTKEETENLTTEFFEAHGFPQCIGAIDGTHIEIMEPREHYTDFINRKGYTSINVQAVCDYKYCFMDVVVKWPGSVHDARIFQNSEINKMFREGIIPACERTLAPNDDSIPICILGDPAYPLLPFLMKEFPGGGINDRERFFSYRLSSARITIENSFGRLKGRFRCLQRAMDIDIKTLPKVIMACFVLHNYCELKKEAISDNNYQSAIEYEKRMQPPTGNLRYMGQNNEKHAKEIRQALTFYFE